MENPNSLGDPDTYMGVNWVPANGPDNGGVHANAGVQNFWYVLLTDGGTGINDNGDAYAVVGVGLTDAAKIAFRNLTIYLTPSSGYSDARFFSIQSAVDLFGGCTSEVEAVTNAWYAVGVGPAYSPTTISDFETVSSPSCFVPFTVDFTNNSLNGTSFEWDFGDGTTSTVVEPSHTYTDFGEYTVQLIVDGGMACGIDTTIIENYIQLDSTLPCLVTLEGTIPTQTVCAGTLFDSGGMTGDYNSNEFSLVTISPTGASSIDLTFIQFDVEGFPPTCGTDRLTVYDGPSASSPVIGEYCNINLPPPVLTTSSGSVTLLFQADGNTEGDGFQIDWSCSNLATAVETIGAVNKEIVSYFNTSTHTIELSLNNLDLGNYKLVVFNSLGQVVMDNKLVVLSELQKEMIRISSQAKGIYYIKLYNENTSYSTKLVR